MRYKITKSYTVEANSRREARYKLNSLQNSGEADEWLEFESVREIKSSEKDGTGWLNGFKNQLLGSSTNDK